MRHVNNIAEDWRGKGIWNGGHNMHLSYHKFDQARDCNNWNNGTVITNLFEVASRAHEVAFLNKLISAGTLFRWKEDPDQHIYKTTVSWNYSNQWGMGTNLGEHIYNYWKRVMQNLAPPKTEDQARNWNNRNRWQIQFERLADQEPIGAPGGPHNARYTPVNDPGFATYFNTVQPGVPLAAQCTCSDTSFNGDEQGCLDEGGTWTSSGLSNPTDPAPGIRQDFDGDPGYKTSTSTATGDFASQPGRNTLQILEPINRGQSLEDASTNPAIWETEPKEDIGMDIYHEVGQIYPVEVNYKTNELFAPIGSVVESWRSTNTGWYNGNPCWDATSGGYMPCSNSASSATPSGTIGLGRYGSSWTPPIRVKSWDDNVVTLEDDAGNLFVNNVNWPNEHIMPEDHISFRRPDGSKTSALIGDATNINGAEYTIRRDVHGNSATLPWFNCYSFGNGVESDRVRDDFNQVTIDNGAKAYTTLDEPYLEERKGNGFIWSGIYNSTSGVDNINQFVQAEKITKTLKRH